MRIQGQGSQDVAEEEDASDTSKKRKAINPRVQHSSDEIFEDFYQNYRTYSADNDNL